ncbi:MAG: hypothetical protein ACTSQJ_16615, partial [Promethearchaeota archaeon]
EIEKREYIVSKIEKELKNKSTEIEISKEKLNKAKLEFESKVNNFELTTKKIKTKEKPKFISDISKNIYESQDKEKKRGRIDYLQDILQNLLLKGSFNSCFLIDGKGMIISECSREKLDNIAIGAMFSLICTSILRTIESLNLQNLEYFKMASTAKELLLKNILIENYDRNMILLVFYDKHYDNLENLYNNINKKKIRKIIKELRKEFKSIKLYNNTLLLFENLYEKINFLKNKFINLNGNLDLLRINLLNEASEKIKELFENKNM